MEAATLAYSGRCTAPPSRFRAPPTTERSSAAATFVPRGRALFWQGDKQPHKIEIVQGVVRAVRLLENGNRQILAFYWPGDTVRPTNAVCQHFTAEAVTNCRVLRTPTPDACSRHEPCGVHQVLADTLSLVVTMSQKTSVPRVAALLLAMRKHLPVDPLHAPALQMLIPRGDMADHVGVSLETVCRALAEFKSRGFIDLPNRKTIVFTDVVGLRRVAED